MPNAQSRRIENVRPATARATPSRSTQNAPAEVDPEALALTNLRKEVSKSLTAFKQEFGLRSSQMICALGCSAMYEWMMRTGRPGPSENYLRRTAANLQREIAKRRGTNPPTPTAQSANTSPTTRNPTTDSVLAAVLVRDAAQLHTAMNFDFKTLHRLQKLPDGSILVTREA